MPSDNGMSGLIVADTLISLDFERRLEQRRANRYFRGVEQENLALKQDIDQLLARHNQLVADYNALLEDRKQLAVNYDKLHEICRGWKADYKRLRAWADWVEENGHPGRKK